MNETSRLLIKNGKFKEALLILTKCEEMLEVKDLLNKLLLLLINF